MQDYLMHVELEDGQFREDLVALGNYIAEYDLPALEAEAFLDDQAFIDGANDLIKAANMTAEQVAAAFKTMGYDVEFDDNPQPITSMYHFPETSYSVTGNMEDGTLRMIPHTTMRSLPVEDTVAAPTIKTLTSTGSQGGRVPQTKRSPRRRKAVAVVKKAARNLNLRKKKSLKFGIIPTTSFTTLWKKPMKQCEGEKRLKGITIDY